MEEAGSKFDEDLALFDAKLKEEVTNEIMQLTSLLRQDVTELPF